MPGRTGWCRAPPRRAARLGTEEAVARASTQQRGTRRGCTAEAVSKRLRSVAEPTHGSSPRLVQIGERLEASRRFVLQAPPLVDAVGRRARARGARSPLRSPRPGRRHRPRRPYFQHVSVGIRGRGAGRATRRRVQVRVTSSSYRTLRPPFLTPLSIASMRRRGAMGEFGRRGEGCEAAWSGARHLQVASPRRRRERVAPAVSRNGPVEKPPAAPGAPVVAGGLVRKTGALLRSRPGVESGGPRRAPARKCTSWP